MLYGWLIHQATYLKRTVTTTSELIPYGSNTEQRKTDVNFGLKKVQLWATLWYLSGVPKCDFKWISLRTRDRVWCL